MYTHTYACAWCAFVREYRYPQSLEKVVGSPEAGVTGSGEAPQVVARNQA